MLRRSLLILAPLAAVATGCTTLSDRDAVARVDDVELTQDEFEERLVELGATDDLALPLDPVRAEITRWIQSQLVPEDEVAGIYGAGPDEAGIICVNAIVVTDGATADAVVDELEAGTAFTDVFQANNIDPSLTPVNGVLRCFTSQELADSADIPFVAAVAEMSEDEPISASPVLGTDGAEVAWVVMQFRPFAELAIDDVDAVVAALEIGERALDADVFVDSRYGFFDPVLGEVVGLG